MIRFADQFLLADRLDLLIHDRTSDADVLADGHARKDDAVLHDGALLDDHASTDDRIAHRTFDLTAVGHHGMHHGSAVGILRRCRVIGPRIDRPL